MMIDYLADFPIPANLLPKRLQQLLQPVGLSPDEKIEVASLQETDPGGSRYEHLHMLMAVAPGDDNSPIEVLREAQDGVIRSNIPYPEGKGCVADFSPSLSGYDYIVSVIENGLFYSFNLAEKVSILLGLTPRCLGGDEQKLIYDDLSIPKLSVATGSLATEYNFHLKKNVSWHLSNEYLRRYLWLRGARGVRVFFYSSNIPDSPEIRAIMNGDSDFFIRPSEGVAWYELRIREHEEGLRLWVWASVVAILPELCPEQSADVLAWPGVNRSASVSQSKHLDIYQFVYICDKFLEKYEKSSFYDAVPFFNLGAWYCDPSYKQQWSFTECRRVGRNLIQVSLRELYKPKPVQEIVHANRYAVHPDLVSNFDKSEEHIVSKTDRFFRAFVRLGESLADLGRVVGESKRSSDITGFDSDVLKDGGWGCYPCVLKLSQVAPLDMPEQDFLSRCKTLHEIVARIPAGFVRRLLEKAGCPRKELANLGSIKLLQALVNVVSGLNAEDEGWQGFASSKEPENWKDRSNVLAPLFLNNDLRIADAHESIGKSIDALQKLGFDTANLNQGYGKALDFVMDKVIESLEDISGGVERVLGRA